MLSPQAPLASIQYLRALAALAVVAYHALQWRDGGFDVGRAGVDVFFVISGVIMWRIIAGRPVAPAAFLWRRLTRVAPPYWLASLAVAAIAVVWPGFLPQISPDLGHLGLSLAFIPHFDPFGRPFPTLPPGWTLIYEAIFYSLVALALLAPPRDRGRWIIGGLLVIVFCGLALHDPVYVLFANPMMLQFMAGVGLSMALDRGALGGPRLALAMLVAGGLGFGYVQMSGVFSEMWRWLLWGAPATLIVAGALSLESHGRIPDWPRLRRLGDASYALYIWHLPAVAIVAHVLGLRLPVWIFLVASLATATIAGWLGHTCLERPLLRFVRQIH